MISVLTTTYNCGPYIYKAVKSILNQSYTDFEYIIIDDGSEDETETIVNLFDDKRIRYIKIKHIGRGAALNVGLNKARYDYVALQDADDISHQLRLEMQLKKMTKDINTIVVTDAAYFKNNRIRFVCKYERDERIRWRTIALHGPPNNASMIFNKKFILNEGGYNESLISGEDHELWQRIIDKVDIKIVNKILYFIRLRADSLSDNTIATYQIHNSYIEKMEKSSELNYNSEKKIFLGWIEFFYGEKKRARKAWKQLYFADWNYKILIAYLVTFLPTKYFNRLRKMRIRSRIEFLISRFIEHRELQYHFQRTLIKCNS